ncbi:MAG: nucleoside-diphosphate sugar epimerase/dehydratase [Sulfuricurvum sp.]|nr:nucleoside-diphosphate sugar epimerase/dehydratase [Sulfuricurvum sp.]
MSEWFRPTNSKRIAFFLLSDAILSLITLYSAYLLRFNFDIPSEFIESFPSVYVTLFSLKVLCISLFKNYTIIWRFYSLSEAKNLLLAHLFIYGGFTLIYLSFSTLFFPFPRSVIIIDLVLSLIFLGGIRLFKRMVLGLGQPRDHLKPTLLVGISPHTGNLIKSMQEESQEYFPVGIVALQNHNRNMIGSHLGNIKISGIQEIDKLISAKGINAAILDGSLANDYLKEAYQILTDAGITDIKRSALLSDGKEAITSLSVEELLARHPKDLDTKTLQAFIQNKTVLITGGGGSIGSEIALQCHRFGAKKLILIDHSEFNLYQIGEKLPSAQLNLCTINDREKLDAIMDSGIDILIHAAAYKHVPLCEANPQAAVINNIIGSRNVIDSALKHRIPKIVIISTDKAVRPTNIMGATKRVVELYAQNVDSRHSEIVSVRFGNVLGSSGSVIPKFKSQIEAGGPITITHPDVTRYFMLISEACQLVLQAAAIAKGGELFILDMGEPVKIIDLAQTMIRLYATKPVEIVSTGLRPGEKLYEELLIDESEQKTAFESILIAHSSRYDIDRLNRQIDALVDSADISAALEAIVPEFAPSPAKA